MGRTLVPRIVGRRRSPTGKRARTDFRGGRGCVLRRQARGNPWDGVRRAFAGVDL